MGKRRKQRKGGRIGLFKPGCVAFEAELESLRDLARDHGLTVDVSIAQRRKRRPTYHVMFKYGAARVLDYWPGNGTVWSMETGEKGKVPDCWAALDEAARIASAGAVEQQEQHLDA